MKLGKTAIALIEDDPLLRVPTAKALDEAGFLVISAANGAEGLAVLQDADIDFAIINIILPGHLDGLVVAVEAKKQNAGLQIVFTGEDAPPRDVAWHQLGGFLRKPYEPHQLLALVTQHLVAASAASDASD
jgi:two-component system OmpR family response regulator